MFDIGFWEILLILVLALIIIGPERLPGAARKVGYWVGRARRFVEGVRNDVESEVDLAEFRRLLHNQEVQINELQQRLRAEVTASGEVESAVDGTILTDVAEHRFDARQEAELASREIETDAWSLADEQDGPREPASARDGGKASPSSSPDS